MLPMAEAAPAGMVTLIYSLYTKSPGAESKPDLYTGAFYYHLLMIFPNT